MMVFFSDLTDRGGLRSQRLGPDEPQDFTRRPKPDWPRWLMACILSTYLVFTILHFCLCFMPLCEYICNEK